MFCYSYALGEQIDIKKLQHGLMPHYKCEQIEDAIILETPDTRIIVFNYGCAVIWLLSNQDQETKKLIHLLSPFVVRPHPLISDEFEYEITNKAAVKSDKIFLRTDESLNYQMLAVSYALSQSAKLAFFEERIYQTIEETRYIPLALAKSGRINLSHKKIAQKIGELYIERSWVNLHTDILDSPEFFWDNPEYDELYNMARADLSLTQRTSVLNTRLDIIRELFEVLGDELKSRHSTLLEWSIVIMIFIEVTMTFLIHVFKVI